MSDLQARSQAVRDYAHNLVVVAGAGTGKTSLLVERVLNQMLEGGLGVTEFAAITFTEKAACEMRIRLEAGLARLVQLARHPEARAALESKREADRAWQYLCERVPAELLRERAERAQADLVHATISTIHGFCAALLRRFPVQAGVDPDFSVDDGLLFDALRQDLWQRWLASPQGPEGDRARLWSRVLGRLDLPEIQALALAQSGFGLPRMDAAPTQPDARRVLEPLLVDWIARCDALVGASPARGPESFLVAARALLRVFLESGPAEFRAAAANARFEGGRGERSLLDGDPPSSKKHPEAQDLARETASLLKRLERVDDALISDALELVHGFGALVRSSARERNVLPFDALLALARDMLVDHPVLRRRLAERYRVLFVDEFQDTDPLQYEIVFFLSEDAEGPPAADAFETRLAAGRLFIVGDPKQAIYRFRGADIHAYHAAVRHLERCGGRRLALTTSWRARPEILEPLDRLFPSLLVAETEEDEEAYSGYDPLESGRARADDGPRVEIWTVGDAEQARRAKHARRDEADAIAAWIAREATEGRLRCGQVALLFRSLRNLRLCTRALGERGVPFAVEAGRDLLERPEGRQLQALLRALASPADAPAVLGVLRSPLGAVPDAELARYAVDARSWSYLESEPDARAFPNLARAFAALRGWRELARTQPLDTFLCFLAERSALLPLHAAAADGLQRVCNLRHLLDPMIELARREPAHDLASLLPWLERGDTTRSYRSPDEGDAVRIMSIHAAKGLEFPIVILPDLGRDSGDGGRPMGPRAEAVWLPDEGCFAIDCEAALSSTWLLHERAEERHGEAESKRLFYVACTRAQERLILVHAPRKGVRERAIVRYLRPWGYTAQGLGANERLEGEPADIATRFVDEPGDARFAPPEARLHDEGAALTRSGAIAAAARARCRPAFASATGLREQREAELETEEPAAPRRRGVSLGREVGTVMHELLERWDFRDPAQARRLFENALAAESVRTPGHEAELRRRAGAVLDALLEGELPAYLSSVEVIARELPLLFEEGGQAFSGTLDLLYLDPDGRPVIADYKTDREPDEATLQTYRSQLEIYARGIRRAFRDLPAPALELIWLRTGERLRLPDPTMRP